MKKFLFLLLAASLIGCIPATAGTIAPVASSSVRLTGPTGTPAVDAIIALLIAQGYSACDIAHVVTGSEAVSSTQIGIKLILGSFGITSPLPYINPVSCPD